MIKHFNFFEQDARGRVAVSIDDNDKFTLTSLSGKAPPAWVLLAAVAALGDKQIELINHAALHRRNEYAVERRVGMSGSVDYRLIERRNDALLDYPTSARLHVSMYGKLNSGVRCWIGDLPILTAALIDAGISIPDPSYFEEAPTRSGLDWQAPVSILLTTDDNGNLSYDAVPMPVAEITEEMPYLLGEVTLEMLKNAGTTGYF